MVNSTYQITKSKEFNLDADLRRQLGRAAVSAMSNIAEGFDAGSDAEFRRFLRIGRRSVSEVQSHLYVALDQEYLEQEVFKSLQDASSERSG